MAGSGRICDDIHHIKWRDETLAVVVVIASVSEAIQMK